ncbi:hypothetical protein EZV73_12260 [Acidaminobacter sp. JC074]|uniref:hypothetical protein n=1 Tax=Acidaminobacter sp. JC074 TaxID=2530199 RepID=UPI001F0D5999|nr:hypothetical protein [Acidaminobacter sp. JC074]MCH4888355.1 hypothetical protein [Acidaminobacter sp. JC074]
MKANVDTVKRLSAQIIKDLLLLMKTYHPFSNRVTICLNDYLHAYKIEPDDYNDILARTSKEIASHRISKDKSDAHSTISVFPHVSSSKKNDRLLLEVKFNPLVFDTHYQTANR